jgi:hypothetical protein
MISWLAALTAVVLAAATTLPSSGRAQPETVRVDVLSLRPALHARRSPSNSSRESRSPRPGIDPLQRLDPAESDSETSDSSGLNSVARCHFRVPADAMPSG